MDHEQSILLYLLLFVCFFLIIVSARLPIAWMWSFTVRILFILAVTLLGLTTGPVWAFTYLGWGLFAVFIALPRFLFSRFQRKLNARDTDRAIVLAKYLKWFNWDLTGIFWQDMAQSMAFYLEGKRESAEAILAKWQGTKLPERVSISLEITRMTGLTILLQWLEIIDIWQSGTETGEQDVSKHLAPFAVRAYCELGNIAEAADCLKRANLPEARLDTKSVALTMLPFFCLSGAREKAEKVLSFLSKGNEAEPEYLRLYWWGRLLTVLGAREQAKEALDGSLEKSPLHLPAVRRRINNAIVLLDQPSSKQPFLENDWSKQTDQIWNIFEKCVFVRNILAPSNQSKAVRYLIAIILASYFVSNFYTLVPNPLTEQFRLACYSLGMVDRASVLDGQYWRLFTYLFLHANLLHLGLNLIALNWFGRIAENIFGSKRFLFIYIVSGALSGIAHILLSPNIPAIGASGAIMGIFGAVGVGIFRLKADIPSAIRRKELLWMVLLAFSQVVLDRVIPHVASFAHLGGLLAGVVVGLLVTIPKASNASIIVES